jgi:hypothetical protein
MLYEILESYRENSLWRKSASRPQTTKRSKKQRGHFVLKSVFLLPPQKRRMKRQNSRRATGNQVVLQDLRTIREKLERKYNYYVQDLKSLEEVRGQDTADRNTAAWPGKCEILRFGYQPYLCLCVLEGPDGPTVRRNGGSRDREVGEKRFDEAGYRVDRGV